jgi:predicted ATPase
MRALILRRSEGNPFFVEEIIRMLIERGAIVRVDGGWAAGTELDGLEIPDNLQGLLMARIDRLPLEARDALRVASVIGRQFPLKVLQYVLDRGQEA